jgi:hypothetical protein
MNGECAAIIAALQKTESNELPRRKRD